MALNMSAELWRDICAAAAQYPTCKLHLNQVDGWVKSFSIEHRMGQRANEDSCPPRHVQPTLYATKTPKP